MSKRVAFKIAVSPLVLGIAMVGCTTTPPSLFRPQAASPAAARADKQSSTNFELAQQAQQKGLTQQAIGFAEKAVEMSPRDAGYRMLLGDLYMKSGRFLSAETAFSDVLTLHADNSRARFQLALSQISLGKPYAALVQLDRLAETQSPVDLGLAYALAGQPDRAIAMLEPAARAADANSRVRQNLALAYAFSGDWQRAQSVAAQDLSPADLSARMQEWASFTQPQSGQNQVASLLGVTPVQDAGQPTRLALAVETPAPIALAQAEAPVAPEPVAEPAVEVAQAVEVEMPVEAEQEIQYAEAAQTLSAPQPAIIATTNLPASAPIAAFEPAPAKPKTAVVRSATGRYVVQIGAYRSALAVEQAWSRVQQRYGLADYAPVSATVSLPKGVFHRLSVAGFGSAAEAASTCRSIKVKGGACFVRNVAGDAPIRWASRDTRKG